MCEVHCHVAAISRLSTAAETTATARHRFELQNMPPASSIAGCSSSTEVDISQSFYSGATMTLSLYITVRSGSGGGGGGGCLNVEFERSIADPEVAAMLALPYQQTRQRLHVIKKQFDDLSSTPGTYLMPLAIATNTATRLSARCQIDIDATKPPSSITSSTSVTSSASSSAAASVPSAMDTWFAEMKAFPAR